MAERGSFTAAAQELGYTQSAVSRQVAGIEAATGQSLFERHRAGARLTAAGRRLLPRARLIVDELDAALADTRLVTRSRVRLGTFPMAAAAFLPEVLVHLQAEHPDMMVTLREATTPALVRAVRAGTLDLALVAHSPPYRPFDAETPGLDVSTLDERELVVAVGPEHPFGRRLVIEVEELNGQIWVASASEGGDSLMGVWPGLAERADVRYIVRDWLTKVRLVAAGLAITTVSPSLAAQLADGVRTVAVRGGPREARRLCLIRLPGPVPPEIATVSDTLWGQTRPGR